MEVEAFTRTMPNNLEAEQSIIGTMLMNRQAILTAGEILVQDDFYYRHYGIMFQAMVDMNNHGQVVDMITVQEKLRQLNAPDEITSIQFLRDLMDSIPHSGDVTRYAKIVKNKSILRNIIKTTEDIANTCYEGNDTTEAILEDTEKRIFELVKTKGEGSHRSTEDIVTEALDRIQKAAKNRGSVTGVPTMFKDLDDKLSGLQPSDFILVAARPSMGKTAFVLNIAENVAIKQGITTAIFSLEMSDVQLINRMLSLESSVGADKLRKGNLDGNDWGALIEGADKISAANEHLIIDATPGISISELRSKCRKFKMEHNLGLIIIDYLQLMSGSGSGDNRQQQISEISRSLKALAREINVPVITLSQLSRAVEQRPDHRPMLSDLRESGAIEQDADVVMFLYRDDYYNKDSDTKGMAEVIIAKQRNGPIGTVKMAWIPDQTRFADFLQKGPVQ